jgi:uncharacterized protein
MKTHHPLILLTALFLSLLAGCAPDPVAEDGNNNLAEVAVPTSWFRHGGELPALNDGLTRTDTGPLSQWRWSGFDRPDGPLWVQYEWSQPIHTSRVEVFWWDHEASAGLPDAYRIMYWDGDAFREVSNADGLALVNGEFNETTFDVVETTRLRIEAEGGDLFPGTLLEWVVYQEVGTLNHPPLVDAGVDRDVMVGGDTYLSGMVRSVHPVTRYTWSSESGPGGVRFGDRNAAETTATFTQAGDYVLRLTAEEGSIKSHGTLKVKVHQAPDYEPLDIVYTKNFKIDNPLWNDRAKAIMVNWIPWCIDQIEDHSIATGGLDNFIEAAKALRGEPYQRHKGYVFSNAWVHQIIESMSIALMVDPQGDPEIIAAQQKMEDALERWIPIVLAAQHPDGYLQTAFTLRDTTRWQNRWEVENRRAHEGYVGGYFMEAAINHYTLTNGTDLRLYDAAKKLADCWDENIGPEPGKIEWYDGHQGMEMALVRFGRFVNDMEGGGAGDRYINLAKFLLDSRGDGVEYDQSHVPVQQQYEAVGHAVRATYNYAAMADVAMETQDTDYQSATMALWNNVVNKKYYVTGGIGSGETSEGFGPNYSLRNNAYCESCSSCGLMFWQQKMNMAYHDAKYADLYEETMYNALLGSLDLEGENFYYTNPLTSVQDRYPWHNCPCCVGNIPRTLLMIPTWTYLKDDQGIYMNLFIGSTVTVEDVGGIDVEMVQETDYPWSGEVGITVNPASTASFAVRVRVPDRKTSELYESVPAVAGIESIHVNGEEVNPTITKGYAVIDREWQTGDRIDLKLPMEIQTITADERIAANRGRVAMRYGPLIYSVEAVDNQDIEASLGTGPFALHWRDHLLNGVMTIEGQWADGSPFVAIPNYVRNNRNPEIESGDRTARSHVWVRK